MAESADILEEHLAHLSSGASLPASTSDAASELDALLGMARRLQKIGQIQPSPAVVQRTRVALAQASRDRVQPGIAWRPTFWGRPAMALAIAVGLMTPGTMSVLAAPAALPDSPLYTVRNLREEVEVRLAGTPAQRAALYANFAEERSVQLRHLAQTKEGSSETASTLLHDIAVRIHEANQQAHDDGPGARSTVQQIEGKIDGQLGEVQQTGGFSREVNQQLENTIRDVQSNQSTDAIGDGNNNQP